MTHHDPPPITDQIRQQLIDAIDRGITQAEVARGARISEINVSRFRRGVRNLNHISLDRLGQFLELWVVTAD
jgi:transcriptional regulator with XRE-family HTH domain